MLDRTKFFDAIRPKFKLTTKNVNGFDFIIDYAILKGTPRDDLSYILATTWHETAHTMQPIAEYGKGRGKVYGKKNPVTGQAYYGRGYVQLTWYENYLKAGTILGVDFVNNPDLVMQPEHAVRILFEGMNEGWFTGKKLRDYIDLIEEDYKEELREFSNARRIINGTDKQVMIGQYAWEFREALRAAGYGTIEIPIPTPNPSVQPPVAPEQPTVQPEQPINETLELVLKRENLKNVTLLDFYTALKALIEGNDTNASVK